MKTYSEQNVYDAAIERLDIVFRDFDRVCVSFSGGKDSTVLLHLALEAARRHGKLPLDVMFIDLEAQYKLTIDHVAEMMAHPDIRPWWIALPLNLRNAVSVFQTHWCCWDPDKQDMWVRSLPAGLGVISDQSFFPFFRFRMEFEDLTPAFGEWLTNGASTKTAVLVGIRADESLNRFRTIVMKGKARHKDIPWTTGIGKTGMLFNAYPIYDWRVEDIWKYIGSNKLAYNHIYDRMYLAGKSIHEQRICQPYGDDQRKGLDLFREIEPETWPNIIARVSGANYGAIYCGSQFLGYHGGLGLPDGHTWKSYTKFLMATMPDVTRIHFDTKFKVFIDWWEAHGYPLQDFPDQADVHLEAAHKIPSWRRMCMCILKNDFWCKSLSFAMTKDLYGKYYQMEPSEAHRAAVIDRWSDI